MIPALFRPLGLATLLLAHTSPALAQAVSGPVRVIDGDTLDFTGTRVELAGIDAPELKQTCTRGGAAWSCGEEARALLTAMTRQADVTCEATGLDISGTLIARCHAGESELSSAMIGAGLAVALPGADQPVIDMEQRARKFALGLWGGAFEPPATWRSTHPELAALPAPRRTAVQVAPPRERTYRNEFGCAIKGNQSYRGDWIYHLPGMPRYDATRAEAFFCTERAAQAAGYRRSKDW